jgi:hypothetical protein
MFGGVRVPFSALGLMGCLRPLPDLKGYAVPRPSNSFVLPSPSALHSE